MKQNTLNILFKKEKLWFNKNIHANLVINIYSLLLNLSSEGFLDQDEYFVQDKAHLFLQRKLTNTIFKGSREVNAFGQRRIDNSVVHTASGEGLVYYEIKTFIKESEQTIDPKYVYKDIIKLTLKKKTQPFSETYLIFAGKSKYIKDLIYTYRSIQLPHKYVDINNRSSLELNIEIFKNSNVERALIDKLNQLNINRISISPSRWIMHKGISVLTWRINKIK